MKQEHSTLVFRKITTEDEAQILRTLRNECKDYMTRNNDYITETQQSLWFRNLDKDKVKLYLAMNVYHGSIVVPAGFGILRLENDKALLTGGLSHEHRGQGHGELIFRFLIEEAKRLFKDKQIELEVLRTNMVARNLYSKLGFIETKPWPRKNDNIITMEYR